MQRLFFWAFAFALTPLTLAAASELLRFLRSTYLAERPASSPNPRPVLHEPALTDQP